MDINPYASPDNSASVDPDDAGVDSLTGLRDLPPFVSARFRAIVVIGLLVLFIISSAAIGFVYFSTPIFGDEQITAQELSANIWSLILAAAAKLIVVVLCIVMILAWLFRAHKNLPALGAERLEFTPGWVIGWWFVPFMNLVRPYQVVREIWQASNPDFVGDKPWRWRSGPVTGLILAWWLCWLAAQILDRINARIVSLEDAFALEFAIITEVAGIVAALLLIALVLAIDKRQTLAYRKLCGLRDASEFSGPIAN